MRTDLFGAGVTWFIELILRVLTPTFYLIDVVFLATVCFGVYRLLQTSATENNERKHRTSRLLIYACIIYFFIKFAPIIGLGFLNHGTFDSKELAKKAVIIAISFLTTFIIPKILLTYTTQDFQADMVKYTELERKTVISHETLPILLGAVIVVTAFLLNQL